MQQSITTVRKSNIELLRIFAMLLIVAHHFTYHSGFEFAENDVTANRLWVQFLGMGGKIGVDIFVLISGWFLCTATPKTAKVLRFWAQLFFWSVTFFAIFTLTHLVPFSLKDLVKTLLPITFSRWWFASAYLLLYLFSPYLNRLLDALTQKQYRGLLALTLTLWSIVPTLTSLSLGSNNLLLFFTVYALGGYLRKYNVGAQYSAKKLLSFAAIATALTYSITIIAGLLGTKYAFIREHAYYFFPDIQSLSVLIIATLMLLGSAKLEVRQSKFLNTLASATFGVYLIHEHPYVRPFLWQTVLQCAAYAESDALIGYSLFAILAVYLGCTALELARIHILEKPLTPVFAKIAAWVDNKRTALFDE